MMHYVALRAILDFKPFNRTAYLLKVSVKRDYNKPGIFKELLITEKHGGVYLYVYADVKRHRLRPYAHQSVTA